MNAGWKSPHLAEPTHVAGPAHLIWTAPKSSTPDDINSDEPEKTVSSKYYDIEELQNQKIIN